MARASLTSIIGSFFRRNRTSNVDLQSLNEDVALLAQEQTAPAVEAGALAQTEAITESAATPALTSEPTPVPEPVVEATAPQALVKPALTKAPKQSVVAEEKRMTAFNPVLLKVGKITNQLSPGTTLFGNLVLSEGGIRIRCHVEGTVVQSSDSLVIVDQEAVIHGSVTAQYLLVLGTVNGDLTADRIVLGASAKVNGDIKYSRTFGAVAGSQIDGRISKVVAQPTATPVAPTEAEPSKIFAFPTLDRVEEPIAQYGGFLK
ncbi:bactofilin family protein [Noviherbaspirillum galbum]|uniref:Polymer-forming cytoskeletal protein n=1 Tax=Noviherbaspirillum galbum TaxID=2709383 RepID=A0A6B3SRU9_9BURK|nr:polymer-forming cytoskeletal protein [Noviherbaspirillum galbum]NEX63371.1 hypothetical protein [Noviherbaspirillum galbum]